MADWGMVVQDILRLLVERQNTGRASVLALHGDLGAGKTTCMQFLGQSLGIPEAITSPTFVVMKSYPLQEQSYTSLVHIDAYRIEDSAEMNPLHFDEILATPRTLVAIEWAEHITDLLPSDTLHLTITDHGTHRTVSTETSHA